MLTMNKKNEYLLKSDVEKILTEWAIKAWQDEWKPTHENTRGDTFIEAKLIVSNMPSIQIDKLIQGETNDIDN